MGENEVSPFYLAIWLSRKTSFCVLQTVLSQDEYVQYHKMVTSIYTPLKLYLNTTIF